MKQGTESPLFEFTKQFNRDIPKPPAADVETILRSINEWIGHHKDALLLAWFAQYGFEPGKAVLVYDGIHTHIREATPHEMEESRQRLEKYRQDHPTVGINPLEHEGMK